MLLITYHTWYTWKKIMFKTVSVFHKLTLKLPYNPIIFKNRIFFTISDFVDIILIFFRIQRTIWWWNFFGSPINFLHFRKNAWNCTIFKTQYLIKYSKYTKKNFTIVFVIFNLKTMSIILSRSEKFILLLYLWPYRVFRPIYWKTETVLNMIFFHIYHIW